MSAALTVALSVTLLCIAWESSCDLMVRARSSWVMPAALSVESNLSWPPYEATSCLICPLTWASVTVTSYSGRSG